MRGRVKPPEHWVDVEKMGGMIPVGKSRKPPFPGMIVAARVPLNDKYAVSDADKWTPRHLLEACRNKNMSVHMIIDLTNTYKYYDGRKELHASLCSTKYVKMCVEGFTDVPSEDVVQRFIGVLCSWEEEMTNSMLAKENKKKDGQEKATTEVGGVSGRSDVCAPPPPLSGRRLHSIRKEEAKEEEKPLERRKKKKKQEKQSEKIHHDDHHGDHASLIPVVVVHCTHGLNRTGYLIVRYLIATHGYSVKKALQIFQDARPPGLIKHMYIRHLYGMFEQTHELELPVLPLWAISKYDRSKEDLQRDNKKRTTAMTTARHHTSPPRSKTTTTKKTKVQDSRHHRHHLRHVASAPTAVAGKRSKHDDNHYRDRMHENATSRRKKRKTRNE
jgi:hypothetical protein